MDGFHRADVQAPEHLRAGVHPQLVPGGEERGHMTSQTCLEEEQEEGSPVSHGHLLQHGRARVGLPVPRYRSSPETVSEGHLLFRLGGLGTL